MATEHAHISVQSESVVMTDKDQSASNNIITASGKDTCVTVNTMEEEVMTTKFADNDVDAETPAKDTTVDSAQDTHNVMEYERTAPDSSNETEQSIVTVNKSFAEMSVDPSVRVTMLARVAVSDAHFKHQQRGDPDLSMEEKIEIVQNILDTNKVNFLSRFGQYLELDDLEYFKNDRNIYEIDFFVKQIMKNKSGTFSRNRIKNRRFEAMKELVSEGEYFSDDEMKFREPYLFDQMVGQYLTEREVQSDIDKADLRFSTILIKHMDHLDENARFAVDKDKEEGQEEEEDSSDEEDQDIPMEAVTKRSSHVDNTDPVPGDSAGEDREKEELKIPEEERNELRAELLTIMQERFLNGEDKRFDYSKVDNNEAYDDFNTLNVDAEEKYFDDEDSASVHSMDSNR